MHPTQLKQRLVFKIAAVLITSLMFSHSVFAQKLEKITLSGPFAGVSNPLIHMAESGALSEFANKVEFKPWNGTDQLRLMAMGKGDFSADFLAMPSNVAANLYNRGVPLKLMNISVWGVLWMVSRDDTKRTLADFKGAEIAMPFRADMPDIVFEQLAIAQGLDPKKDFKLRYTANPLDAMQLLIMRRVDHALLAEPAISMALRKTKSFPVSVIAPELFRSVDLQQEWGRVYQREARIPQAGVTALGATLQNPALLKAFNEAYAKSLAWCVANPEAAAKLVVKHISALSEEAVVDSFKWTQLEMQTAQQAKPELTFFYGKLLERTPASVGNALPDEPFYYAE